MNNKEMCFWKKMYVIEFSVELYPRWQSFSAENFLDGTTFISRRKDNTAGAPRDCWYFNHLAIMYDSLLPTLAKNNKFLLQKTLYKRVLKFWISDQNSTLPRINVMSEHN